MTHEYGDPISAEAIETAAELALHLRAQSPEMELRDLVEEAVRRSFCACVLEIADQVEHGVSGMHLAVTDEVLALLARRGEGLLATRFP
jgi:hypothetical protein